MEIKYMTVKRTQGATRENFYKKSYCEFTEVAQHPLRPADYISASRSSYWYTDKGIYRNADHWGWVASCEWYLANTHTSTALKNGFATWESFERHELETITAEAKKIYKNGFALLTTGERVRIYKEK